jgi:molybdopterin converting factor small subunit
LENARVQVTYFAQARELAATKEEQFLLSAPADLDHLLHEVLSAHPQLAEIKQSLRSLVNGQTTLEDVELKDGDRITLFPPVGGG